MESVSHLFFLTVLPVADVVGGRWVNLPERRDGEHRIFDADLDSRPVGVECDIGWTDDG